MDTQTTLLQQVVAKLAPLKGAALFAIADETGISYDTILRIRDGKVDPTYSKVETLAGHFRLEGYTVEQKAA